MSTARWLCLGYFGTVYFRLFLISWIIRVVRAILVRFDYALLFNGRLDRMDSPHNNDHVYGTFALTQKSGHAPTLHGN